MTSSSDFLDHVSEDAVKSLLTFDMGNLEQNLKEFEELMAKSNAKLKEATERIRALDAQIDETYQLAIYYQSKNT